MAALAMVELSEGLSFFWLDLIAQKLCALKRGKPTHSNNIPRNGISKGEIACYGN